MDLQVAPSNVISSESRSLPCSSYSLFDSIRFESLRRPPSIDPMSLFLGGSDSACRRGVRRAELSRSEAAAAAQRARPYELSTRLDEVRRWTTRRKLLHEAPADCAAARLRRAASGLDWEHADPPPRGRAQGCDHTAAPVALTNITTLGWSSHTCRCPLVPGCERRFDSGGLHFGRGFQTGVQQCNNN